TDWLCKWPGSAKEPGGVMAAWIVVVPRSIRVHGVASILWTVVREVCHPGGTHRTLSRRERMIVARHPAAAGCLAAIIPSLRDKDSQHLSTNSTPDHQEPIPPHSRTRTTCRSGPSCSSSLQSR